MGFFNNLFKKKEKKQIEDTLKYESVDEFKDKPKEEVVQIPSPVPKDQWVCEYCKGTIDVGERWSKKGGMYFHKQCYKLIKRGAFNGN